MAIRKNTNPREMDLQPEMRDILMRNGMQAHIIMEGDAYKLAVRVRLAHFRPGELVPPAECRL